VIVLLISLPFLAVGSLIAMYVDAKPLHVLDVSERARIDAAAQFVDDYFSHYGRVPTVDEFKIWADHAPSDLRLDGVGFEYSSLLGPSQKAYAFSFWEGGAWVTWQSTSPDKGVADVSPTDAFFAGSKWADLFIFFSTGIATLLVAIVLFLPKRRTSAR
jgi:hypothetical protein